MEKQDKRKLVDWEKKNGSDSERISKRLEGRSELDDAVTTKNDSKPKRDPLQNNPAQKGAPLLKLRRKIREACDEDEEEDEGDVIAPFFNISLIDDDELEHNKAREEAERTMRITKQQQLAGKLNLAMSTAMSSPDFMDTPTKNKKNAASENRTKMHRRTIRQTSESTKPHFSHTLSEEELEEALLDNNNDFTDSDKDISKEAETPLNEELDQEDLAKLILQKSGRKAPKKSLIEIAKGINRYESYEQEQHPQKSSKEKE